MEKIYITNSNYENLLINLNAYSIKYNFILTEIEEGFDKGTLFSQQEKDHILLSKNFILKYNEFYKNNKKKLDIQIEKNKMNQYYLFTSTPAYHKDANCKKLHNDYENYKIDKEIPQDILKEYKEWVHSNLKFLKTNLPVFYKMHEKKWGNNINIPKYVNYKNSSSKEVQLDNIKELKIRIKKLYEENVKEKDKEKFKEKFQYSSLVKEDKIYSYIIRKYKELFEEIHMLKAQIARILLSLYISEQKEGCNVEMLEKIGLKPCKCCCK